ncbi:MAG: hypothetical protein V3T17_18060 [Pseudomonadales bacterium]
MKFAIVVQNKTLQAFVALYKLESDIFPWETKQFTTLEEAREWTSS